MFNSILRWFKSLLGLGHHKPDLKKLLKQIMSTQAQIVTALQEANATLAKIGTETDSLIEKIATLQALVDAGNVTPELEAAMAAVTAQIKVVDDKVPDAPVTPA